MRRKGAMIHLSAFTLLEYINSMARNQCSVHYVQQLLFQQRSNFVALYINLEFPDVKYYSLNLFEQNLYLIVCSYLFGRFPVNNGLKQVLNPLFALLITNPVYGVFKTINKMGIQHPDFIIQLQSFIAVCFAYFQPSSGSSYVRIEHRVYQNINCGIPQPQVLESCR